MPSYVPIPITEEEPLATVLSTLRMKVVHNGKFEGSNLYQASGRVYGGQVFAQAVVAGLATLEEKQQSRDIHSITAAFLRPGKLDVPITLSVEEVLDGRSFSTRRILAFQENKTIFSARASFQERQPGVEHSEAIPPEAPNPESVPSSVDFFSEFAPTRKLHISRTNAVDIRHVDGAIWTKPAEKRDDHTLIWFRLRSPMPPHSSQGLHRAMLAYASDQFMLESVMRKHGMHWLDTNLSLATLDHSIWWHRDVNMSRWVLAELSSPSAQGGRGLSLARYFQDGVHVATMAQEGMVRSRSVG